MTFGITLAFQDVYKISVVSFQRYTETQIAVSTVLAFLEIDGSHAL